MDKLIEETKDAIFSCAFMKDDESFIKLSICYNKLFQLQGNDELYKKIHKEVVKEYTNN